MSGNARQRRKRSRDMLAFVWREWLVVTAPRRKEPVCDTHMSNLDHFEAFHRDIVDRPIRDTHTVCLSYISHSKGLLRAIARWRATLTPNRKDPHA